MDHVSMDRVSSSSNALSWHASKAGEPGRCRSAPRTRARRAGKPWLWCWSSASRVAYECLRRRRGKDGTSDVRGWGRVSWRFVSAYALTKSAAVVRGWRTCTEPSTQFNYSHACCGGAVKKPAFISVLKPIGWRTHDGGWAGKTPGAEQN